MTEDEALFTAAIANPAERTPALALADWFDEHDEPALAVALREEPRIVAFLSELARWDVVPARTLQTHRDGVWADAFQALPAARLLTRYRHLFPFPPGAPERFDPGAPPPTKVGDPPDSCTFLSQWQYMRQRQVGMLREEAARQAAGWPGTGSPFRRVPPGVESVEWRSCIVQEVVLRGNPTTSPVVRQHVAAMREREHPLAWLPLQLSPLESGFGPCLVRFSPGGYGTSGGPAPGTPVRAVSGGLALLIVNTIVPAPESHAFAAVRGWCPGWDGQWEAAEFRLDQPARANYLGADWFRSLPLGDVFATPRPGFVVSRIPASSALTSHIRRGPVGRAYTSGSRSLRSVARVAVVRLACRVRSAADAATVARKLGGAGGSPSAARSGSKTSPGISAWPACGPTAYPSPPLAATDTD